MVAASTKNSLLVDGVGGVSVEPRAARCSIEMSRRGGATGLTNRFAGLA